MYMADNNSVSGILDSQVDDFLFCGDQNFLASCSITEEKFKTMDKIHNSLELAGIAIKKWTTATGLPRESTNHF